MKTIFKIILNLIIFSLHYYYSENFLESLLIFLSYVGANSLINININNTRNNGSIVINQKGGNNIASGKNININNHDNFYNG